MKKFLFAYFLIFIIPFSFAEEFCEGKPVIRGKDVFCYHVFPENYATFEEVKIVYPDGPIIPGWKHGLNVQLGFALTEVLEKKHVEALEILKDVYSQIEFLKSLEKKWGRKRLLTKSQENLEEAIFHLQSFSPRKGKLKFLIKEAIDYIERYSEK